MTRPCACGSGEPRRALHDARGIFCTYVCRSCVKRRLQEFDEEIFTNPNHPADEPIEDE